MGNRLSTQPPKAVFQTELNNAAIAFLERVAALKLATAQKDAAQEHAALEDAALEDAAQERAALELAAHTNTQATTPK